MAVWTWEPQWLFYSQMQPWGENQSSTSLSDHRSDPHEGTVISNDSIGSRGFFFFLEKF